MNPWFNDLQSFVQNWTRPSIQQPRWIKQTVDKLVFPVIYTQTVFKEYLDTWNKVYKPERKDHEQ